MKRGGFTPVPLIVIGIVLLAATLVLVGYGVPVGRRKRLVLGAIVTGRLTLPAVLAVPLAALALIGAPVTIGIPTGGGVALAAGPPTAALCGPPAPGHAACMSLRRTDVAPLAASLVSPLSSPPGFGPPDLQSAYGLASAVSSQGADETVAVVDAYDLATAESDLATYRAQYGLPACTTANGCFHKVDEHGGSNFPGVNAGWDGEIALDIEMVSAACPKCNILLVEASSTSLDDLGTAVDTAAALGAVAISNSYLGFEFSDEGAYDTLYYDHHDVAVTVSSGDKGYGVGYPAASPDVIAVGGTTLTTASNARGWTETAWSGAGSGCSGYEAKPSWQLDTGCGTKRTVADVSAVADPSTPVAVYSASQGGWTEFGGTSVASPLIAATYALAGTPAAGTDSGSYPYAAGAGTLNDVTGGSNGSCGSSGSSTYYLCNGVPGYDGPTGLGTPNGTGAFVPSGTLANDFSIRASPASLSVIEGAAGTSTITTALVSGSAEMVTFSANRLPSGVTGSFNPTSVSPGGSSTFTLTVGGTATTGAYLLTVTGTAASATHIKPLSLRITAPPPNLASVLPASGPSPGGTSVTLTGTGFTGATAVHFGTTATASFSVNSDTSMSAVSPPGVGTVDVTVTTAGGTSATSATDQFTYVPSYWLVASDGGIFTYGDAPFYGSKGGQHLDQPIVGMAATPHGFGYWLVASDGGIFTYGDAPFYGSKGGQHLDQPIVGMAATPDGGGYWEVASDGGIFTYGDALFYGSKGGQHLDQPIVGMAATPDGLGYWLVASDGGIFTYGDALFYGSKGGQHLDQPIVGMAATPDGGGYWLVASDGGIFTYGDALFYGSKGGQHLDQPIVGMAATPDGGGYWLVASDGGIFTYGDALFYGSKGGQHLDQPIVGMAAR